MKKDQRKHLFVDAKVQGALLTRVVLYWALFTLAIAIVVSLPQLLAAGETDWALRSQRGLLAFAPSLIAALVLLPILVIDAIRFSHGFAGPMRRLKTVAQRLAEGHWEGPVHFRKGDYWHDLAVQINRVGDELDKLRSEKTDQSNIDQTPVSA